ncbi:GIY-YIG nuclease family protein [Maribacter sp. 2304DJ31-5]|uniref:GIY-YIG nuclease family protein n=1 Tax=Maribacter sp. 2304DJ31-5 TaxID=3386273 RepID=UPI0039BCA1F2
MHFAYVIRSKIDNSFYIGRTSDLIARLEFHNSRTKNTGTTRSKIPWDYFYTLEVKDPKIAGKIEKHIKKMKSRTYIHNLRRYPEIARELIKKYS